MISRNCVLKLFKTGDQFSSQTATEEIDNVRDVLGEPRRIIGNNMPMVLDTAWTLGLGLCLFFIKITISIQIKLTFANIPKLFQVDDKEKADQPCILHFVRRPKTKT